MKVRYPRHGSSLNSASAIVKDLVVVERVEFVTACSVALVVATEVLNQ